MLLKKMNRVALLLVLLPVLVFAVPTQINFQGMLTDPNTGDPLGGTPPGTQYDMKISLWDQLSSGTQKWTETRDGTNAVYVSEGLLNAVLGQVTALTSDVFSNNSELYLQIEISAHSANTYQTLSPRQKVTSVGYALVADKAEQNVLKTGDTMTGKLSILAPLGHDDYDLNSRSSVYVRNESQTTYGNGLYIFSAPRWGDGIRISAGSYGVKSTAVDFGLSGEATGVTLPSYGLYGSSLYGYGLRCSGGNAGLFAQGNFSNSWAGWFEGKINVTGDIWANDVHVPGGDIAENYESKEKLEPGDVVIADKNNPMLIKRCSTEYDTKVLGVISTNPGLVIDSYSSDYEKPTFTKKSEKTYESAKSEELLKYKEKKDVTEENNISKPEDLPELPKTDAMAKKNGNLLAIVGKVPTKVTTENGPIGIGDLLTTSSKPGYAMKATIDSFDKVGTIIGKALEPLEKGEGKIMVLINLQ